MIEVKNVSKIFKKPIRKQGVGGMIATLFSTKFEKVVAVNHVSFKIDKGEIVGYIGANGAGVVIALCLLAYAFWKRGLRKYEGAGS